MEKLKHVTSPAKDGGAGAPVSVDSLTRKLEEYERWFKTLDSQLRSLERERQKFSAVVNHTDVGFLTLNSSLKVIWTNDVCRQWFRMGEKIGTVINARCCEVLCGQADFCQTCPSLKPFKSGEVAHSEMEMESAGKTRQLYTTAIPIKSLDGRVDEVIVMLQDVTNLEILRRSREAHSGSETLLRSVLDTAGEGIIVVDAAGRIVICNQEIKNIWGYSTEELTGNDLQMLMPEKYRGAHEAGMKKYLETGQARVLGKLMELEGLKKDGSVFPLELRIKETRIGERLLFTAAVRDVTERKRLEEQFLQAQKMEAIGQLAGGIAHDFNNLLTVISGNSEFLLEHLGADQPVRAEVEEIQKAADRAAAFTRQLLAFSRKQLMSPVVLDLNAVVSGMEKMLNRLIGEDVRLTAACRPGLWPVRVDAGQMEQVIMNLVINARDAMPGGGKLTVETNNLEIGNPRGGHNPAVKPGRYVMLTVSDSGCGMSKEVQKRIFEPYFTTKEKGKGTGLGLSTVYGIVQQSGGHIEVASEEGHGTTFKIYLPKTEETGGPVEKEKNSTPPADGSETILLVEDEEAVRTLAFKALSKFGYLVLAAKSGDEAVKLAGEYKEPIHLLLTDVVMPGMGGPETAGKLKGQRPELKVLYMSGYTDNAGLRREVLAAETPFLQKPFTLFNLAYKVREVLDVKAGENP